MKHIFLKQGLYKFHYLSNANPPVESLNQLFQYPKLYDIHCVSVHDYLKDNADIIHIIENSRVTKTTNFNNKTIFYLSRYQLRSYFNSALRGLQGTLRTKEEMYAYAYMFTHMCNNNILYIFDVHLVTRQSLDCLVILPSIALDKYGII